MEKIIFYIVLLQIIKINGLINTNFDWSRYIKSNSLVIYDTKLTSLTGIEIYKNLTSIGISFNKLDDIQNIKNLISLTEIDFFVPRFVK
jgi:Leucine-rich repeat (LRR) protein